MSNLFNLDTPTTHENKNASHHNNRIQSINDQILSLISTIDNNIRQSNNTNDTYNVEYSSNVGRNNDDNGNQIAQKQIQIQSNVEELELKIKMLNREYDTQLHKKKKKLLRLFQDLQRIEFLVRQSND